ncbi:60Kd inner membrane protein-domain-containing protein [Aspergillus karnatakaensis]|uniref:putative mitochondrial export translocase Oxa2 n=1 Tax=Aspergillus karnatakaensis TaxID=1810916 RepID=UPI003CCD3712
MRAMRGLHRITPFQQVRSFHQTRPAPFAAEVIEVTTSFVQGVHSISGLPWALSLPLTAFIVRMGVALPLQIWTKVQARKDSDLAPLLMALRHHYQRTHQFSSFNNEQTAAGAKRMVNQKLVEHYRALRRRWGVFRFWKPVPFLQMPIWIAVMESIRSMSGKDQGFVPWLLSKINPASAAEYNSHLTVEPSLATEGALWFPDLLAGDPTGALPVLLTASILLNINRGWKAPTTKSISELPRLEMAKQLSLRGVRLFIQLLALNVGYSSYIFEMPTALMIYWITSTNIATLQTLLLSKYMFPTPPLKPWKRIHIGYHQPGTKA